MSGFIYIASPYWHEHEYVRVNRVLEVRLLVADLLARGHVVFSPILHNHQLVEHLPPALQHDHVFWLAIDKPLLQMADALWIYCLDGWTDSKGIMVEQHIALGLGIPITYIDKEKKPHAYNTAGQVGNREEPTAEGVRAAGAGEPRGVDREAWPDAPFGSEAEGRN